MPVPGPESSSILCIYSMQHNKLNMHEGEDRKDKDDGRLRSWYCVARDMLTVQLTNG